MSELKKCPFCGGELELTDDDYYWHPFNGCFLDANHVTNNEKRIKAWNTRKPMQNIVERLEEQAEECRKYWQEFDDEDSFGGMNAYCYAVKIVKEEGGLNET